MQDGLRYDALRNPDNDSDLSTEVDDWEDSDDPHKRRKNKLWRYIKRHRWIIDTALLCMIFVLLLEKRWGTYNYHHRQRYEFAGDLTGFAPKFSQQIKTFRPDHRFAPENASAFWNEETRQAWLSIVPEGLGYVVVNDPAKYDNLPKPIHDYPNQTVFTTSMTHQLHCLYTILDAYNKLSISPNPALYTPISMPWHINHCFEYLRQAIMCTGDVALEGAATTFPGDPDTGEDRGGSDGWDAKHICKDYREIYQYLEQNTANHEKWIASD